MGFYFLTLCFALKENEFPVRKKKTINLEMMKKNGSLGEERWGNLAYIVNFRLSIANDSHPN